MAEEKKHFATLEEVKDYEATKVGGGFAGSDRYSIAEYSAAGVTWEHNVWSKDRYFYKGHQISQKDAEKITEASQRVGRILTDVEDRALGYTW